MAREKRPEGPGGNESADDLDRAFLEYVGRQLGSDEFQLSDVLEADPGDPGGRAALRPRRGTPEGGGPPGGVRRGSVLGDYTLHREIGRGGMGVVYDAWQASLGRRVALKVLPPGLAADSRAFARFLREARIAGQLTHPNIVHVHALGIEEGTPYIAMEFVEGETLTHILKQARRMAVEDGETTFPLLCWRLFRSHIHGGTAPRENAAEPGDREGPGGPAGEESRARSAPSERRELAMFYRFLAETFAGVADGLEHAHSRGIVHRDVKPSNLILHRESGTGGGAPGGGVHGRLRILDFGLARLEGWETVEGSGEIVGTPLYMSPEQARGGKSRVDHRTDIYSLGATMYAVLAGRPPFQGPDWQATLQAIATRDPVEPRRHHPSIPRDLETIVLKCLRKSPSDRYDTAADLARDLRRFLRDEPIEARTASRWQRLCRRGWRSRRFLLAGAAVLLCALMAAALLYRHAVEARQARERAYRDGVLSAVVQLELARASGARATGRSTVREPLAVYLGPDAAENAWVPLVRKALAELAKAQELFPGRAETYLHQVRAFRLLGEDEVARRRAEAGLRLHPDFLPLRALAGEIEENGEPRPAEPGPGEPWMHAWIAARKAAQDENPLEAAAQYGKLLEILEDPAAGYLGLPLEARLERGHAQLGAGNLEQVLVDFSIAEERWPELVEATAILTGRTHLELGNPDLAAEAFLRAYARARAPDDVAFQVTRIYHDMKKLPGHREKALEWAGRIREDRALRKRQRADCLRHLRRLAEAFQEVDEALDLDPLSADAYYQLASLHEEFGRGDDALVAYERAVELDPGHRKAKRALRRIAERLGASTEDDVLACKDRLVGIGEALAAWREDHRDFPEWLSRLHPRYLPDGGALRCPADHSGGAVRSSNTDPRLPVSYDYQFHPLYRARKARQRRMYGDLVPLVRCRHHGDSRRDLVLNLSFGLEVYDSRRSWETESAAREALVANVKRLVAGAASPGGAALDLALRVRARSSEYFSPLPPGTQRELARLARDVLEEEPHNGAALKLLGTLQLLEGDLGESLASFEKARAVLPEDPETLHVLSELYHERRQLREEEEVLEALVALQPGDDRFFGAYRRLFQRYHETAQGEKGARLMAEVGERLESAPGPGFFVLVDTLLAAEHFAAAREALERRVAEEPQDVQVLSKLAQLYGRLGNRDLEDDYRWKMRFALCPERSWVGRQLPGFRVLDLEGNEITLGRFRGKVVVLWFWATWCRPCVEVIPSLRGVHREYHATGVEMVGVSLDTDLERLRAFVAAQGVPGHQIPGGQGWESPLARKYGIRTLPVFWVLDRRGIAVATPTAVYLGPAVAAALQR